MERVLEEVVLQGLGLTGSGLILGGFEGGHVVERSHFRSLHSSHHFIPRYHVLLGSWAYALAACRGGSLACTGSVEG